MSWFTRFTRFGDMHLVYSQENENSCGIACVRMIAFKVNKLQPGPAAITTEKALDKVYSEVSGAPYDGSAYSYASYLADALNKVAHGAWVAQNVGPGGVARALIDSIGVDMIAATPTAALANSVRRGSPVIVLVHWDADNGGHFVVVDTIHSFNGQLYASVCDPWDGDVHVTPFREDAPITYMARSQSLMNGSIASNLAAGRTSWSTGASEHRYSGPSGAACYGWIVRRSN